MYMLDSTIPHIFLQVLGDLASVIKVEGGAWDEAMTKSADSEILKSRELYSRFRNK